MAVNVGQMEEEAGPWVASRRWLSGLRPGTGGLTVLFAFCALAIGNGGGNGPFVLRAWAGLSGLAFLCITLGLASASQTVGFHPWVGTRVLAPPGWRCPWPWFLVGLGAAGVDAMGWILLSSPLTQLLRPGPADTSNRLTDTRSTTVAAAVVAFAICTPILEEVFFRGCVQSWICRRFPRSLAVVAATLLFTAVHHPYNSVQLLSVAFGGLTLALLYDATRSVLPGIVAHMTFNAYTLLNVTSSSRVLLPAAMIVIGAAGLVILRRGIAVAPRDSSPLPAS